MITEAPFVKVAVTAAAQPEAGAVARVLEQVAAALTAAECTRVRVAWIMAGNDSQQAIRVAPTLAELRHEVAHRWFFRLLDEGGLYMHFQPIVWLQRPEVLAHEALVRATHEGRELSGAEIVAVAAATQLVVPLDARTRIRAIEQFATSGLRSKVFVNFQPSTIYNPRYCLRTTFTALERTGVPPEQVVFEVVESEDVADVAHLRRIIDLYRAHGLGIAMDDFGVGYSTHERLLRLQLDYVKLDKSLCRDVATNGAAQDVIAGILRVAGEAGCRVIAEGIETVVQQTRLRELGVELGQGYLYARPAAAPQVTWPV